MPITVDDVVEALSSLEGQASVEDIHAKVLELAKPPIPKSSREIVRARLQEFCAASGNYTGNSALFENVNGLHARAGIWRLAQGVLANRQKLKRGRNPSWRRDELILAFDLYMANRASPPGKTSSAVLELSEMLNKMARITGSAGDERYRNPNGVYLKMMNLRSLDPLFTSQGKAGMKAGGTLERDVWNEYASEPERLARDAKAIRDALAALGIDSELRLPSDDSYEGEEGGVITRLHRRYERDRRLVKEKKKAAKRAGTLACEVCGFDFAERYGSLGVDFIEVHHINPVHLLAPGTATKLSDLALLCSNCHRMAHRRRVPLSLEELKAFLG